MPRTKPRYQHEPVELCEAIWTAGHITPMQLWRIAAWKSAQGLAWLSLNTEDAVVDRTGAALEAVAPWRHHNHLADATDWDQFRADVAAAVGHAGNRTGLVGLEGVGYPMATAVLSIAAPGSFAVLDRWCVSAVYGLDGTRRVETSLAYAHYCEELIAAADSYPDATTIHAIDQAVMHDAMAAAGTATADTAFAPHWPTPVPTTEPSR